MQKGGASESRARAASLMTRLRGVYYPLAFIVLLGAVFLRAADPPLLAQFRLLVFDTFQRLSPRVPNPDKPVLIVDIDDESLRRVGQWPWPRNKLAALLASIREAGAAAVGIDIVFAEADRLSPEQVLKVWPNEAGLGDLKQAIRKLQSHDEIFAEEIARGRVVMGFIMSPKHGAGLLPVSRSSFAFAGDDPKELVPSFAYAVPSLVPLAEAAAGSGFLNWIPDRDQVIRRVPMLAKVGDGLFPSMAIETLRVAQGASTYIVKSSGASGVQSFGEKTGINSIRVGSGIVPVNADGELLIYFAHRDRSRYVSAWKVLANKIDMKSFEGRIVLLGTSAAGLFDMRATPLESAVPGIEVHAQAIEQIIDGRYLLRPDFALGLEIVYMTGVAIIMILLLPRFGAAWSAVFGAAMVAFVCGASYWLFVNKGWLSDPIYPSLAAIAPYLTGSAIVYLRSETARRQVRSAFSHYLAPALVNELAENPDALVLGGETREVTLLFTDIRGFTTISEGMDAPALIAFVNKVLSPLSEAILEHRGTIDKYMGDAVMAFWNAPLDDPDHARNAALTALDMQARLEILNQQMEGSDAIAVRIGIGISTGPCSVGNMGTEARFDYSVIGDDVNLAARLEGQTKAYGVDILIAGSTAGKCGDLALLEADLIQVKGKTEAVSVYVLLGGADYAAGGEFFRLQQNHQEFLSAYRAMEWDQALQLSADCREIAAGRLDGLYDTYKQRIEGFAKTPPPEDWGGVYVAQSK